MRYITSNNLRLPPAMLRLGDKLYDLYCPNTLHAAKKYHKGDPAGLLRTCNHVIQRLRSGRRRRNKCEERQLWRALRERIK